jgi:trk system potassium uptake protein TrkA
VSIGSLLAYVRRGDVERVHSLRRGAAEALEIVAHGDRNTSKVVGRRIDELPEIKGAHIAAIVRRNDEPEFAVRDHVVVETLRDLVVIPHHDTVIEADDHVVVFCTRKRTVREVEKLFQVSAGFL